MAVTANVGGVNYSSNNSVTPYKDIYDQYVSKQRNIRDAFQKQLDTDQSNRANEINSQYNSNNTRNYVNYMQAKKNLPSELNAAGINGGATESSILRLGTNYGSNVAENESGRAANLAALAQTYATKKAEYDEEFDNKLQSAYLTLLENQNKYEQEQREKDLQYFANSITGRFGKVSEYQDLIKQLQASSDPNKNYKIALAQQAMNALSKEIELQKSAGSGGSRSSGYRSYGGYSYGGGGSGDVSADTTTIDASPLVSGITNVGSKLANAFKKDTANKTTTAKKDRDYVGTQFGYYQFR